MELVNKTIITVAPTGAWPSKTDNPNIPLQPEEISQDIINCSNEGAAIVHIHVRDDNGKASMSYEKFEQTVKLVRKKSDIVINLTTSGGIGLTDDIRIKPFEKLLPEIASFDCGSMNWLHTTVFENSPSFLEKLGLRMQEVNVKPEIEIFDVGMVYNALYYLKKGVLKPPLYFQFVLGAAGGIAATPENLIFLKSLIPEDSMWGAFGIGKGHLPILYTTLALGGNVRVGMEDNVVYHKGILADSNAQLVARAVRLVEEMGKKPATPDEARQILGLTRKV